MPPAVHPGPARAGVDAFSQLRIVDFGDAPVVPAYPQRAHEAIEPTVGLVLSAGALPVIIGGDHSITEPNARACAARACAAVHGPLGLLHFDTRTDTGADVFGATVLHGSVMRRIVEAGHIDPRRYVQTGYAATGRATPSSPGKGGPGITSLFMHDVRDDGIRQVTRRTIEIVGAGPVFLTVDIDVLDPAFIPGATGTPEPGRRTSTELLWVARTAAAELELVGADLVDVIPTSVGSADAAALVGGRIVREILTGIAIRRRAGK